MSGSSTHLRLVCGVLASAARLVPVPLLDDFLREKALQLLVSRALSAHGRTYGSRSVGPLFGDDRGLLEGCALFLLMLPIKLIVYPVRKIVAWVLAAKHLASDLCEAVLLGRVVDRCLAEGRLAQDAGRAALWAEARLVRRAFSNALAGSDMRLVRGAVRNAVRSVPGLWRSAFRALGRLRRRGEPPEHADQGAVGNAAERAERALETPEVRAFLERFDARFDENLRILEQRAEPPRV